jgi:Exocyst complex component Sec5
MASAPAYSRQSVFEPSTWAEVEDAAASRKVTSSRPTDPVAVAIFGFTECPGRCVDGTVPNIYNQHAHISRQYVAAETTDGSAVTALPATAAGGGIRQLDWRLPPKAPARAKRNPLHIEDPLGLGRVDLESQEMVRRYTADKPGAHPVPPLPDYDDTVAVASSTAALPALNPSSASFNPAFYLARIHRETPLHQLREGLTTLSHVATALQDEAAAVRKSSHASIVLAASAVEQTRRNARAASSPLAEFLDSMQESGDNPFVSTEAALDEKYRHILDRQQSIDRLKRVLGIVRRFSWLFELPSALRAAAESDIIAIEGAARQLGRAREWAKVQDGAVDGPAKKWIERELEGGVTDFVNSLKQRLCGPGSLDRRHLSRLVNVLETVGHGQAVEASLYVRMGAAKDALRLARESSAVSAVVRARVGGAGQGDAVELTARMSNAFVDGLSQFWDLARVVVSRPKWSVLIDVMLPSLVGEYAESVRDVLLTDVRMVTRDAALEVERVRSRAVKEIRIPSAHLGSLSDIADEVIDVHVSSLVRAVRSTASFLAHSCFASGVVGTQLATLAVVLAQETLSEVVGLIGSDATAVYRAGGAGDSSTTGESSADGGPGLASDAASHVSILATTCVRIPEFIAHALHQLVTEKSRINTGSGVPSGSASTSASFRSLDMISSSPSPSMRTSSTSPASASSSLRAQQAIARLSDAYGNSVLGTARCCSDCLETGGVVESICAMVTEQFGDRRLDGLRSGVEARIRAVGQDAVKLYCVRLCPEVRKSARRIAELRSSEGLRTSQSMDIESASAQAVEVLLNVCMAVCRARQFGARCSEISLIERVLVEEVASTVGDAMTKASGGADMAAQIWVDVSFLSVVFGDIGGPKAAEGFARAQELAANAVRRVGSGSTFGNAEAQTLRRRAVDPSVTRARLVRQALGARVSTSAEIPDATWVRSAMSEAIRLASRAL